MNSSFFLKPPKRKARDVYHVTYIISLKTFIYVRKSLRFGSVNKTFFFLGLRLPLLYFAPNDMQLLLWPATPKTFIPRLISCRAIRATPRQGGLDFFVVPPVWAARTRGGIHKTESDRWLNSVCWRHTDIIVIKKI